MPKTPTIHPDAIELGGLLRDAWPTMLTRLRASGVPLMADDPPADPPKDPPADPPKDPPADPPKDPPTDPPLGDAGKAALDKERADRKAEKKRADGLQAKLDEIEAANLTEAQKLQKQADEGNAAAATATEKLRKANLITALADKGLAGAKAKAAARLLDAVEYDDDDEPKNLDAAITAAKAEYGDEMFKAVKPKAPKINPGDDDPENDETPALTAEELQYAKSFGMTPEEYANYQSAQPKLPEKKTT